MMNPDAIMVSTPVYRLFLREMAAGDARDHARAQGLNWRKVKRLARKAAEQAVRGQ